MTSVHYKRQEHQHVEEVQQAGGIALKIAITERDTDHKAKGGKGLNEIKKGSPGGRDEARGDRMQKD